MTLSTRCANPPLRDSGYASARHEFEHRIYCSLDVGRPRHHRPTATQTGATPHRLGQRTPQACHANMAVQRGTIHEAVCKISMQNHRSSRPICPVKPLAQIHAPWGR